MQHIVLTLEAPLMSFGREKIDQNRPTWDFPGLSMITGLLANALGYTRWDPPYPPAPATHQVCLSHRQADPQPPTPQGVPDSNPQAP